MTDGQHLPEQNAEINALETNEQSPQKTVALVAALVVISTALVGVLFWLFSVNASATDAKDLALKDAAAIEKKADREDMKEIKQEIRDFRKEFEDYLKERR